MHDYARALPAFQKILDNRFADGARIQYEIADTYFRQNNLEQARIEFEAIVKNFPQSPLLAETLFRIGATFALEGNLQDAEFLFLKLMEEHPESPFAAEAEQGLASVLERRGDLRSSLVLLEKLRKNNEKPGVLDQKIEQIRERMQKKKKAI
jgi:TolA-binding protein